MPIYEYVCKECGKHFDVLRSMKEADAPIACEGCQSLQTTRQLSKCYAQSGGKPLAGSGVSSSGCGSCAGGHCSSCGN